MERKAAAATRRHTPENGATAWAVAAIVAWAAVLIAAASISGIFGELSRHTLLIGALSLGSS